MRNQNRSWKSLSVPHGWTTELINTPQRKKTTHASPKKLTYLACIASARQKPPPSFHARSQPAMRFFPSLTSTGPIIMTTSAGTPAIPPTLPPSGRRADTPCNWSNINSQRIKNLAHGQPLSTTLTTDTHNHSTVAPAHTQSSSMFKTTTYVSYRTNATSPATRNSALASLLAYWP